MSRTTPCDNCQYRLPVAGVSEHVGGLKALLFSLRHGTTHTQAMPHVHAHRPLTKHVLVCGNVDCAERGSVPLLATLRRLVRAAGRDRDLRVTRTHCMGRCGEGPTVAVYPEGSGTDHKASSRPLPSPIKPSHAASLTRLTDCLWPAGDLRS